MRRDSQTDESTDLGAVPIATLMILRGQLKKNGVFPPETLDREEREVFFKGIKEWGIKVHRQVNEVV